jgi:hypothetical protein
MDDPKQFLSEKLNQEPNESKKYIYARVGLGCLLIVWLGTLICMFIKTDIASHFVSLATMVVSGILAITTTLLTGQAVFEYKAMSTMATVDTNDKEEKKIEVDKNENVNYNAHIIKEGDDGAPELKPFGQHAVHPDGYDN